MEKIKTISCQDLQNVDGGLLAGALAGTILGGTVGLVGATGYGISKGKLSGGTLYRGYVAGALTGCAIGAYMPI